MHLDGAKSWTMRSITNIQTSQTRVYRDHSLELKAWEFLKEKVWSGAAHVSQELSKCLCSSQHLMGKSSWAKYIVKTESRLLHSSVSRKNRMYVNVRKEKSLKVHSTSRRKLSKERKTRTCRAWVHGRTSFCTWVLAMQAELQNHIYHLTDHLDAKPVHGSCRQTGSVRHYCACLSCQPLGGLMEVIAI